MQMCDVIMFIVQHDCNNLCTCGMVMHMCGMAVVMCVLSLCMCYAVSACYFLIWGHIR